MMPITTVDELNEFKQQRTIVSWYLDYGYDVEAIGRVLSMKRGFDVHVRDAWALLIPYADGYVPDDHMNERDYGVELAARVIHTNRIRAEVLPVILFENYEEEYNPYFYISLAGLSTGEIYMRMAIIADIIIGEYHTGRALPSEFRFDVAEAIKRRERIRLIRSLTPGVFRTAFDLAEIAVGLKT